MAKTNYQRAKQLNSKILSFRDPVFKDGVQGEVGELRQMFKANGEPKRGSFDQELYTLDFIDLHTGEVKKFWADGGVRGALALGEVKPGAKVEIVHTGETEIEWNDEDTGKTGKGFVQTYDVFALEA
jgi:hypothetical protein